MQTVKVKSAGEKRMKTTRLSPREIRLLADQLVAAKDPAEVSRLKRALERGFYGDPENA